MISLLLSAARPAMVAGAVIGLLSACGGSGGGDVFAPLGGGPRTPSTPNTPTDPGTPSAPPRSFTDLSSLAQNLYAQSFSIPTTPAVDMPTTGTASYKGAASYVAAADIPSSVPDGQRADYIVANPRTVSDVNLTANFGTDTIGGSMANFVDKNTGTWQGTMTLSNGVISGNGFLADVGGSLGPAGQQNPTSGSMLGIFGGNAADFVGGGITMDSGVSTPTSGMLGVFVATQ